MNMIQIYHNYDTIMSQKDTIMIQICHNYDTNKSQKIQLWYKYDKYILNRFKSNI